MSEQEYQAQLDAVAEYLTLWRVAPTVRAGIRSATARGPGYTGGGGARAVRYKNYTKLCFHNAIKGRMCHEWCTQPVLFCVCCPSLASGCIPGIV